MLNCTSSRSHSRFHKIQKLPLFIIALLSVITLSGCDSSDGDTEANARHSEIAYPLTTGSIGAASSGIFSLAGVVQGLEYKTASISGVTDEFGVYHYFPGEEIEFSVGGTVLGKTIAKTSISPMDLVAEAKLPSTQDQAKGYVDTYLYLSSGYLNDDTRTLDIVVNISSLIISLDSDKNSDNGIKIHAGSLVDLKNISFDITQQGRFFESSDYYSTVLHQLYNKGYLANATAVKSLLALDLYIQSQLPLAPLFILAELKTENDNKELITDWIHLFDSNGFLTSTSRWLSENVNRHYRYEYGHNGDYTYLIEDIGANYEVVRSYQYNQHGKRTVREECGKFCFKYAAQYNNLGHQVGFTQDSDRDGNIDRVNSMEYDARGNLLLETRDYENDGEINDRLHYQYDDQDRVTHFERDDGKNVVRRYEQRWDENSRLVYFANYPGLSETPDKLIEILPSEEGEVSTSSYDRNYDGELDETRIRVSNHGGQLLRETFDKEGDGIPESINIFEYDENGNMLSQSRWYGSTDYSEDSIYYYSYDQQNRRISTRSDFNHDGEIDQLNERFYDNNGYLSQIKDTDFEDGAVEISNYQKNDNGQTIYWEKKVEGEEIAREFSRYSYDGFGEIILLEKDTNGDGAVDYISEYDRSATGYYINKIDKNANGIFEKVFNIDQYGNFLKAYGYNDTSAEREHYSESRYKQVGYLSYFLSEAKRFY